MGFLDAFIGVPQSKVAAISILVALGLAAIALVVNDIQTPMMYRLLGVGLIVLMSIPSLFVTLMNITCVVSGSQGKKLWWCDFWAWILSAFVMFYAALLIIAAVLVLTNKQSLLKESMELEKKPTIAQANSLAVNYFASKGDMSKGGEGVPTGSDRMNSGYGTIEHYEGMSMEPEQYPEMVDVPMATTAESFYTHEEVSQGVDYPLPTPPTGPSDLIMTDAPEGFDTTDGLFAPL